MSTLSVSTPFTTPCRPSGRPAIPNATLRLTRRGRWTVVVLLLALVLAVSVVFAGRSAATRVPGESVETRTVVVSEGDTLWAIAAGVAGPGEIRDVVHQIEKLNALPGPALVEGQQLVVPIG